MIGKVWFAVLTVGFVVYTFVYDVPQVSVAPRIQQSFKSMVPFPVPAFVIPAVIVVELPSTALRKIQLSKMTKRW